MKVSDLVALYGVQAIASLPHDRITSDGNIFFVDSGNSKTLDADNGIAGQSWAAPFATLNYAISMCTASQGDIILLAARHAETLNDLGTASSDHETDEVVCDVAGINIIGLGVGLHRPTFTCGTTATHTEVTAGINVTAANVMIKNIRVVSGLATVSIGITVGASADGFWIEDCYISDGNTNILELVIGISIAAECDDVTILNCTFHTVSGGNCNSAIYVTGGADRLRIEGCYIFGYYAQEAIDANQSTASKEIILKDNVVMNIGAGMAIALVTTSTGTFVRNMVGSVGDTVDRAIVGEDAMYLWENYEVDTFAVYGIIAPATTAS